MSKEVGARRVRFDDEHFIVELNDEREIALPFKKIRWLTWLARATPEQRARWSIEPYGYAVWWEDLDDGIEVVHALSVKPLPHRALQLSEDPTQGKVDTAQSAMRLATNEHKC